MDSIPWPTASRRDDLFAAINERLEAKGLSISPEDAQVLADQRSDLLREMERVEFGTPPIIPLVGVIATTPVLTQEHLPHDLAMIQIAFYRLRDELSADVPDSEICDALHGCLNALGDSNILEDLETDEIMRFSNDYVRALDAGAVSEYRIIDEHGRVYAFNESDWEYDEQADGWDGERWSDNWNDETAER